MNTQELKQIMTDEGISGIIARRRKTGELTVFSDQPASLEAILGDDLIEDNSINIQLFEKEHTGCVTQLDYDRVTARFDNDHEIIQV